MTRHRIAYLLTTALGVLALTLFAIVFFAVAWFGGFVGPGFPQP